jgi:phosphoglycolate phosphatase-like HAD superfamily hydrolase
MKLILFDLDGTILSTQGAGMKAMNVVGERLWGQAFHFREMTTAGSLDPHLFAAAAKRAGVEPSEDNHRTFRQAYHRQLHHDLASDPTVCVLPGVLALLDEVHRHPRMTLGMLTGNYAETAAVKLRSAAIDPRMFVVAAFGDDASDRPAMVPVALDRHERLLGRRPSPGDVILIGDTPRDVQAAHAHGCLALAVATGPYTVEQLGQTGAEAVVRDLSDPAPLWKLAGL